MKTMDAYSATFNVSAKAQEEGYKESTNGVIRQNHATFFWYYWGDEDQLI